MTLKQQIEELSEMHPEDYGEHCYQVVDELRHALNDGRVRAAEPTEGGWQVNAWVKKGILLGFRIGRIVEMPGGEISFYDKHTFPVRKLGSEHSVRLVPGGSSIRDGAFVGKGVTCMPPMYINVGAYVDDDTMVDSHALVGSCAQIGKRVHLSAAAQVGGVLEPVGAMPVIIEDEVLVGGNCGIYEGTIVGKGAILAAGTILTGGTPVYDLVYNQVHRRKDGSPLKIPPNAVVVPGSRPISKGRGKEWNLSIYSPVIVKYRDEKTEQSVQLEDLLR